MVPRGLPKMNKDPSHPTALFPAVTCCRRPPKPPSRPAQLPNTFSDHFSTMSTDAKYSDIKSSSASPTSRYRQRPAPTSDINELHARLRADPRFNPPPPSPWKRAALILFVVFLLWFAYTLRKPLMAPFEPKVVHARRSWLHIPLCCKSNTLIFRDDTDILRTTSFGLLRALSSQKL